RYDANAWVLLSCAGAGRHRSGRVYRTARGRCAPNSAPAPPLPALARALPERRARVVRRPLARRVAVAAAHPAPAAASAARGLGERIALGRTLVVVEALDRSGV